MGRFLTAKAVWNDKENVDWKHRKRPYPPFFAARFCFAQPSFRICLDRPIASESAGTSSVMHEAAPTYDPLPNLTGATKVASLPTKTPSSITVLNLFTPS